MTETEKIVIVAGTDEVPIITDKSLLMKKSPLFQILLKENRTIINMPNVRADVLNHTLHCLTGESVSTGSFQSACEVYRVAKECLFTNLIRQSLDYFSNGMTAANVLDIFELAERHSEEELVIKSTDFICLNTNQILSHPSFLRASFETVKYLLGQDELNIECETELADALVRYVRSNIGPVSDIRNYNIQNAVRLLRFFTLSPKEFAECEHIFSLLTHEEALSLLSRICSSKSQGPSVGDFSRNAVCRKNQIGKRYFRRKFSEYNCKNVAVENSTTAISICTHREIFLEGFLLATVFDPPIPSNLEVTIDVLIDDTRIRSVQVLLNNLSRFERRVYLNERLSLPPHSRAMIKIKYLISFSSRGKYSPMDINSDPVIYIANTQPVNLEDLILRGVIYTITTQ